VKLGGGCEEGGEGQRPVAPARADERARDLAATVEELRQEVLPSPDRRSPETDAVSRNQQGLTTGSSCRFILVYGLVSGFGVPISDACTRVSSWLSLS
jgi:hypothetical protein